MSIRKPNPVRYRSVKPARRLTLALAAVAVVAVVGTAHATAATATGTPVGLPGPPPLAMTNYPTPPVAGSVPPASAPGSAATVPAKLGGPGLLSGVVRAQGRQVTLQIACSGNGSATLSATAIAKGTLARGAYTCTSHQASAQPKLSAAAAHELGLLKSTLGHVKLGKGGATTQYATITLESRPTASPRWSVSSATSTVLTHRCCRRRTSPSSPRRSSTSGHGSRSIPRPTAGGGWAPPD